MDIEIRDDCVKIDGYVNAVERNSKQLKDKDGFFVEKIKSGAFDRAINRAKLSHRDIKVLLNHNYDKELTNTRNLNTKLYEDNIGLRCKCEVRDSEIIAKAKDKKLVGWSFGFIKLSDSWENDGAIRQRCINDLELREVSILDSTKIPAYNGTSIEARELFYDEYIEIRMTYDSCNVTDYSSDNKDDNTNNDFNSSVLDEFKNKLLLTRCL